MNYIKKCLLSSKGNKPFYPKGYAIIYSDVQNSGLTPYKHYKKYGMKEGRDNGLNPPAEMFFREGYELMYPDVAKSGVDPWIHYVEFGRMEGRDNGLNPPAEMFFREGYELMYPEVEKSGTDAWIHYVKFGRKEGRDNGLNPPAEMFFREGYELMYPDVAKSGVDSWIHYATAGKKGGFDNGSNPPLSLFSRDIYKFLYPDVEKSGIDLWVYYVNNCNSDIQIILNPIVRKQTEDKNICSKKSVLFISNELSATGAPYCLKNMAKIFIESGFRVEIWTFPRVFDAHIFDDLDCCIYVVPTVADNFENLDLVVKKFTFIICNTVLTASYVNFFMNHGLNYLWMIHEGKLIPHFLNELGFDSEILNKTKSNAYVVSEYVSDYLYNEFNVRLPVLHNFVEDQYNNNNDLTLTSDLSSVSKKVIFTFCGSMDDNKRLDDCISAFLRLNIQMNDQWEFNIVGSLNKINESFWSRLVDITRNYHNIIWHDKLVGNDKLEIFRKTDVFLVPSKEESSSLVVIEAAMLAKTFVVTKNVGTKYLAKNNAAFVLEQFDIESIEDCVKNIIAMPKNELAAMGAIARKNYLATSTKEIFKENIYSIISKFNDDDSSRKTVLFSTEDYLVPNCQTDNSTVVLRSADLYLNENRNRDKEFNFVNEYLTNNHEFVDVIVVVRNDLHSLQSLFESMLEYTDVPHRFVFIDDCSEQETKTWLYDNVKDRFDCILIENETELGFVKTLNKAVKYTERNFVILSTEAELPSHWLSRLVYPLYADSKVATVSPVSNYGDIAGFPCAGRNKLNRNFLNMLSVSEIDSALNGSGSLEYIDVPQGNAVCTAVSHKVWDTIGCFNELLYGDGCCAEIDFCRRAVISGWKNVMAVNLFIGYAKDQNDFLLLESEQKLQDRMRQIYQHLHFCHF